MSAPPSPPPKSRPPGVLRTVAWGLLGVGGRKPQEPGAPSLSPLRIVITALVFMLVFVLLLVTLASYIGGRQ